VVVSKSILWKLYWWNSMHNKNESAKIISYNIIQTIWNGHFHIKFHLFLGSHRRNRLYRLGIQTAVEYYQGDSPCQKLQGKIWLRIMGRGHRWKWWYWSWILRIIGSTRLQHLHDSSQQDQNGGCPCKNSIIKRAQRYSN